MMAESRKFPRLLNWKFAESSMDTTCEEIGSDKSVIKSIPASAG